MPTIPDICARAYNSININVPQGVNTVLPMDSERWDTDTIHDNVINNSRLTCQTAGTYYIEGNVAHPASAASWRALFIRLNGSTFIATHAIEPCNGTTSGFCLPTIYQLGVGDYVELVSRNQAAGGSTVSALPNYSPEFSTKLIAHGDFDYGARVYRATQQTFATSPALDAISFSNARWDTDGMWDIASPTRLTCQTPGKYVMTGTVQMVNDLSLAMFIRLNGSTLIGGQHTNGGFRVGGATIYDLEEGDYIECLLWQSSGGNQNCNATGNYTPEFAIQMISEL
jgi:hypothetical protein